MTASLFWFFRCLAVVHFCAAWAPQCTQINEVLEELSKDSRYKKCKFIKVCSFVDHLYPLWGVGHGVASAVRLSVHPSVRISFVEQISENPLGDFIPIAHTYSLEAVDVFFALPRMSGCPSILLYAFRFWSRSWTPMGGFLSYCTHISLRVCRFAIFVVYDL